MSWWINSNIKIATSLHVKTNTRSGNLKPLPILSSRTTEAVPVSPLGVLDTSVYILKD